MALFSRGRESELLTEETGDEEAQATMAEHVQGKRVSRILATGCLVVGAAMGYALGADPLRLMQQGKPSVSSTSGTSQLFEVQSQPSWAVTNPERDLCTNIKYNCHTTKCCKTTGYVCKPMGPMLGKCVKECSGSNCTVISEAVRMEDVVAARSLYCFAAYTYDTGNKSKKSYEKELLALQFQRKASIFACDKAEVYSDVAVTIAPGLATKKVEDTYQEFHLVKRKKTGTWANAAMFMKIWEAVGQAGFYKIFDWTVKADPDAVFVPDRLRMRIQYMPRPVAGGFLTNCKHVDYGFFGNLEVFTTMAFDILVHNWQGCRATLPWKIGIKGGKYGPMGEDLFAEKCMEKNGVDKLDAFDITVDGACPADRPLDKVNSTHWRADCSSTFTPAMHPFKKPDDYKDCLDATMNLPR